MIRILSISFFILLLALIGLLLQANIPDQKLIGPSLVSGLTNKVTVLVSVNEIKNLEQVFSEEHKAIKNLPKDKIITLIATGDVIPARSVNFRAYQYHDFTWPYQKTVQVLRNADLTFINLESPLIENCPLTNGGMIFCSDHQNLEGLKFAGVDIANLANNHSGNYGQAGVENTAKLLAQANILVTGTSGPVFKEAKGTRFAFLGYNALEKLDEQNVVEEIKATKLQANVVIVAFHWGTEYTSQPNPQQKNLAHLAINSGADLIIGNHPHWIQPVEIYQGKFITYAHGNFIFDQMWSEKTEEGVVGKYTFYKNKLVDIEFLPIRIEDFGQAYFLEGAEKTRILEGMKQESLKLRSFSE
ncbi:MAG: CapA family protein [Candidatus Daviesbacteria bacterium]